MAVKYECPKCGRKFTEWGAEKLGFHCPTDEWCPKDATEEIQLVRAGSGDNAGTRAPSLKRRSKKAAAVVARVDTVEDEAIVPDIDEVEEVDEEIDEEVEIDEVGTPDVEKAPADEVEVEAEAVVADDEEVDEAEVADLDFDDADSDSESDAGVEANDEEEWS